MSLADSLVAAVIITVLAVQSERIWDLSNRVSKLENEFFEDKE